MLHSVNEQRFRLHSHFTKSTSKLTLKRVKKVRCDARDPFPESSSEVTCWWLLEQRHLHADVWWKHAIPDTECSAPFDILNLCKFHFYHAKLLTTSGKIEQQSMRAVITSFRCPTCIQIHHIFQMSDILWMEKSLKPPLDKTRAKFLSLPIKRALLRSSWLCHRVSLSAQQWLTHRTPSPLEGYLCLTALVRYIASWIPFKVHPTTRWYDFFTSSRTLCSCQDRVATLVISRTFLKIRNHYTHCAFYMFWKEKQNVKMEMFIQVQRLVSKQRSDG